MLHINLLVISLGYELGFLEALLFLMYLLLSFYILSLPFNYVHFMYSCFANVVFYAPLSGSIFRIYHD